MDFEPGEDVFGVFVRCWEEMLRRDAVGGRDDDGICSLAEEGAEGGVDVWDAADEAAGVEVEVEGMES